MFPTGPKQTALQTLRQSVGELAGAEHNSADPVSHAMRQAAAIELACYWEATAPKVGNVNPTAAFDDCCYEDFCRAGRCIAPILAGLDTTYSTGSQPPAISGNGLGDRVLRAIEMTRRQTAANVNLGIVLLIAPLALARDRKDIPEILAAIDSRQAAQVYRAIGLAKPGGIKRSEVESRWDVTATSDHPGGDAAPAAEPLDLIAAMRMASQRDRIALQYADDFCDFFESVLPIVANALTHIEAPGEAILTAQLQLLARHPDSLIARKCGDPTAIEAMHRAATCVNAQGMCDASQIASLDRWLRAQGNQRNPGTTADLIAAALYWLIR